jgi:hypothetical protein
MHWLSFFDRLLFRFFRSRLSVKPSTNRQFLAKPAERRLLRVESDSDLKRRPEKARNVSTPGRRRLTDRDMGYGD